MFIYINNNILKQGIFMAFPVNRAPIAPAPAPLAPPVPPAPVLPLALVVPANQVQHIQNLFAGALPHKDRGPGI